MPIFVMQARSSTSGAIVTWQSPTPDFAGVDFPGPGAPLYVAVSQQRSVSVPRASYVSMFPTLDPEGTAPVVGQCVCTNGDLVRLATSDALSTAGSVAGVVVAPADADGTIQVASTGVLPVAATPLLGPGSAAYVKWNPTTHRLERVAVPTNTDALIGHVDTQGALTLMFMGIGLVVGEGSTPPATPWATFDWSALPVGPVTGSLPLFTYTRSSSTSRAIVAGSGDLSVSAAGISANEPVIVDLGTGKGMLHEEGRFHRPLTPSNMQWFDAAGATITHLASQTAPDGSSTADQWTWGAPAATYNSGLFCFTSGISPATKPVNLSLFIKLMNSPVIKANILNNYTPGTPPGAFLGTSQWTRIDLNSTATGGNAGHNIGAVPGGSVAPIMRAWSGEITDGMFPVMPVGVSTSVTTAPCSATSPVASTVRGTTGAGAVSHSWKLIPMGACDEYVDVMRIEEWDPTTFVQIDNTTNQLTISSSGTTWTPAKKLFWNRIEPILIYYSFGGGVPSRAAYRVVGGPLVDLGTGPVLPNVSGSVTTVTHFRASDGSKFFSVLPMALDAYDAGQAPPWTTDLSFLGTYRPNRKNRGRVFVYGNSRVAGGNHATVDPLSTSCLNNWDMINIGHSAFPTEALLVAPYAPTEVDPMFDPNRYVNVFMYTEIVNSIAANAVPVATAYANIVAMHNARRAAGYNKQVAVLTPMADPARFPSFASHNSDFAACNALIMANFGTGNVPLSGSPFDAVLDLSDLDLTSTSNSPDGLHYTSSLYLNTIQPRAKVVIEPLYTGPT